MRPEVLARRGRVHCEPDIQVSNRVTAGMSDGDPHLAELKASEARFRATFENAAVGMAHVDAAGYWVRVNQRLCEIVGYSCEELLQRTFQDLTHPDDLDADVANVRRLLAGEVATYAMEKRYVRRDGSPVWVNLTVSLVRKADGAPDYFIAVIEDITARRSAIDALRESEERLRVALDGGRMGLWDWDVRNDRAIWNHREFELLGLPPTNGPAIPADFFRLVHPQDLPGLEQSIAASLASGADLTQVFRVVRPDGEVRWLSSLARVYRDGTGQPLHMAGVNFDVTEHKEAEERLREREAFARKVLTSSLNGLYVFDLEAKTNVFINPQYTALTGYTADDLKALTGDEFLALFHPEDLDHIVEHLGCIAEAADGQTLEVEYRFKAADGRWIWCLSRDCVFERDPEGEVRQIIGTFLDITGRKQAEERLLEADRRKDEFLAMLAHELRNPLAPIRNAVELFRLRGGQWEPDLARALEIMERQVAHMARLLDDLLDVARITRGKIVLHKEQVALAEVITRAMDQARPQLETRNHRLELSLPPASPMVEGDPVRLTQVVSNLLDNAAKYSSPGQEIGLSIGVEEGEAVIRVSDSGIGIDPKLLPEVFELFVQSEQGLDRTYGGLGMGLPVVRRLVEMHGGGVEAASEGRGKGSTFTVRLPLCAAPGPRVEPPSRARAGAARQVLVVDDDPDVAESFAVVLQALGASVEVVHDGPAALAAVGRLHPDVVFLDIGLPGMDGYDVAQRLREEPAGRAACLIAVSGYGREEDLAKAEAAGFDNHLLKPVALDALQAVLDL
jgi:PAS domain S-box-containing protein